MIRAALLIIVLGGCSGDPYLVVTVNARPAVTGADSLAITLSNAGTMRTDTRPLDGRSFPVTFSIDPSGRTGELDISIEADSMGVAVGQGSGSAMIGDKTAAVLVDTVDFVVNTEYAGDQFLSMNFEANGLQLGADSNGVWTAGFRDNCNGSSACNVFGRRFDNKGVPQSTVLAAGTNQFVFTTDLTYEFSTAAVATSATTTLAVWDFQETVGTPPATGVACRALDGSGNAGAGQLQLSSDAATSVSLASLSDNNFAVVWEVGAPPSAAIHAIIAKPDCTTLGSVMTVSTTEGTTAGPATAHVAANAAGVVMYAWITDGNVYVRAGTDTGLTGTTDTKLIPVSMTAQASNVRLAPMGTGFALVVRSVNPAGSGTGQIQLFQLASNATLINPSPLLITNQSQSDFTSGDQATGVATRASDGEILIVWHACDAQGSTGSCRVYGQQVSSSGALVGGTFILSTIPIGQTTQIGDQTAPSAIALPDGSFATAWNDTSHLPPDNQGYAVRARIIYPDSGSGM